MLRADGDVVFFVMRSNMPGRHLAGDTGRKVHKRERAPSACSRMHKLSPKLQVTLPRKVSRQRKVIK